MKAALALCLLASLATNALADTAPSRLDEVLQRGTLNVCTTGDYTPYSALRADGTYEGIDIAMAESLAKSLNASIHWVPTTWKSLMPDFLAQRCDIAVGGISVSLERQKKAFFSQTLGVDGKIPLVRCAEVQRYQSVEQINQPQVRVIEPAGGTNEAFARAHLANAQIRLHDNVTIFDELLAGKADVMITDASEARFQQKRKPGLCAVNPERQMQYGEKAYLLPRDDVAWKSYVDQWLHLSVANGVYAGILDQWLAAP
ncbi:ArtI protein [Pseudomonas marginalis ICMP 9505]|uniref:Transporter substrate-binding domain-containing protein n=1 Tax=Pseudomonas kitaguniensis TaxID=2607908 RepID=A0A5N7JSP0_9PSED|nr:transporter substrate-binding domain-containing protein [Pseudomonas kitaguniensis]KTC25716.1 ArtI protein [Pseudomonas marginalis ICMP 9505]MPQ84335.1 transporter substrate-binding domain-containing protein [Pseudomonas kitaguniensis]MPR03714.1 transporter substrate-binding domain-containing protein [Pseudomonas kitaguniensis]